MEEEKLPILKAKFSQNQELTKDALYQVTRVTPSISNQDIIFWIIADNGGKKYISSQRLSEYFELVE